MKEKVKKNYAASRFERASYEIYFFGQNILYMAITTFLSIYYTGSLGIPATVVAAILVGARIWDAFVDPMLAAVIEKAHLKSGKFKPWVRLAAFTVPILTVLCFGFNNVLIHQSLGIRIVYAIITYFIWGTIYAASDAPAYALSTVMTPYPEERNMLLSYNKITGILGAVVAMTGIPMILSATNNNYFIPILVFSLIAFLTMIMATFVKERVRHDGRKQPSIRDMAESVAKNKYLLLIVIILIFSFGFNFTSTLAVFVATDIYHSTNAISLIMMMMILPSIFVAPFIPALVKKFGKINLYVFAFISTAVLSMVTWFVAVRSLELFLVLTLVKGILSAPSLVIYSMFFSDSLEYDCYKNGTRFEAVTFAAQTFMAKITAAVSGGLSMWIIGAAGYQAAVAGQTVIQTPAALNALWAAMNLGPVVGSIIAAVILLKFYDLTEDKVNIMVEANILRAKGNEASHITGV